MDMKGEYRIAARREQVWGLINDPAVLRACIPGCDSLDGTPETGFTARVTTKIGPVKATFAGDVALTNVNAPESLTISGEGKGGVAGFAKGGADVHLAEDGAQTVLTYLAKAQVGGKLAQLGARLIDSTAKKLADEFFEKLAAQAASVAAAQNSAADAGGQTPDAARPAAVESAGPGGAAQPKGRSPYLIIGLAVVAVVIIAALIVR